MVHLICQPINPVSNQPIHQPVHLPTKQKIYQTVYLTDDITEHSINRAQSTNKTLLMESTKPCTNAANGPIYQLTHSPTHQPSNKPKHSQSNPHTKLSCHQNITTSVLRVAPVNIYLPWSALKADGVVSHDRSNN